MGQFKLIEQKKFQEFCNIYEEKAKIKNQDPELADLVPGNYVLALLGKKDYGRVVETCVKQIAENANQKKSLDRSSSRFYIACSIAKMELGQVEEAYDILYEGRNAKYQDISRTELACVMYYESVMLGNTKGRKTSINLLNNRLRGKANISEEFAIASFILGKCTESDMLNQIEKFVPVLRERHKMQALFYMAIKNFEEGDIKKYNEYLQAANNLYYSCPTVTIEFEYYLTQICLSKMSVDITGKGTTTKSSSFVKQK